MQATAQRESEISAKMDATNDIAAILWATQVKDIREHLFKPRLRHLQIRTNVVQTGVTKYLLDGPDGVALDDQPRYHNSLPPVQ